MKLDSAAVKQAILQWPALYEMRDGHQFLGQSVSATPRALIDAGWKNVSRLNEYDFKDMGLEIVDAQYVGGARPTGKFVRTIIVQPYNKEAK